MSLGTMPTTFVIVGAAIALSFAAVLVRRNAKYDPSRIWLIGRKQALELEHEFEFIFSVAFNDIAVARSFEEMLTNPTVRASINQCPNPDVWSVDGTAVSVADANWYRAVLAEWRRCLEAVGRPDETILVTAGKSGSGVGQFLSTDLRNGA